MSHWTERQLGNSKLVMHCGGKLVTRDQLASVPTPPRTNSWVPIPHTEVVNQVADQLGRCGLGVEEAAYGIYKDGARFFGLLGLDIRGGDGAYQVVAGIRNSHDKSFPVGLVVGSRVFVCDNLAFSSEIQVTRRHTNRLTEDLPRLVATAVGQIRGSAERQEQRFEHYRGAAISHLQAHDLMVQSLDVAAISPTLLPHVLQEWRRPSHEEFQPRTAWSLFNAYTEVYKSKDVAGLPRRTIALQGLFDIYTRFSLAA